MHFDISRDSHQPRRGIARLVLQQGRLLLDADFNEQQSLVLSMLQTLARDVIGWHGGSGVAPGDSKKPPKAGPLTVTRDGDKLAVSGGGYYVDGLLAYADGGELSAQLSNIPLLPGSPATGKYLLLAVTYREREIASDGSEFVADPALGELQTAARTKLVVSLAGLRTDDDAAMIKAAKDRATFLEALALTERHSADTLAAAGPPTFGQLTPRWSTPTGSGHCDPVTARSTEDLENQLYRVEIHAAPDGGTAFWDATKQPAQAAITCKWSRDNGSVSYVATMRSASPVQVGLQSWWRDERMAIESGDWVELIARDAIMGMLLKVTSIDQSQSLLTLTAPSLAAEQEQLARWLEQQNTIVLRRWDHTPPATSPEHGGAIPLVADPNNEKQTLPISLEDGLAVQFSLPANASLRPGDYWLIPARRGSQLLWPREGQGYARVDAREVETHYAPVALVPAAPADAIVDLRRAIVPLTEQ